MKTGEKKGGGDGRGRKCASLWRRRTSSTPAYGFTPRINKVDTQRSMTAWSEHLRGHGIISARVNKLPLVYRMSRRSRPQVSCPFENHKVAEGALPSQPRLLVKCQGGSDLLLSFCDCASEKYHQAVQPRGQCFQFNSVWNIYIYIDRLYFPDSLGGNLDSTSKLKSRHGMDEWADSDLMKQLVADSH